MSNRLPPLAWLKAFEAAGRHQSFRGAAEELNVTPSVISHHVRSLERRLGRPLFHRTGNSVQLTEEGDRYLARISAGFVELARAAETLGAPALTHRLTIGAFPFLVSEVLLPHLGELRALLPGMSIAVVSETHLDRLTHTDPGQRVDAIIRYGDGRFTGCSARKLTDVELVLVGAPGRLPAGTRFEDLVVNGPRIAVAGPFDGWSAWSTATGSELSADAEVLSFDSYVTAMRAAEQGLGVALGIRPLIDPWIAAGRLQALLDVAVAVDQASYLVTAQYASGRQELEILADWLQARVGGTS